MEYLCALSESQVVALWILVTLFQKLLKVTQKSLSSPFCDILLIKAFTKISLGSRR